MRSIIIPAVAAALVLSSPLAVVAQSAQQKPQAQGEQSGGQQQPMVRKVNVIDVSELPPESKPQVDAAAAKASESDLKGLRSSIDQSPEITKALESKGAKSADVILANLDQQGLLTLVTKKRG